MRRTFIENHRDRRIEKILDLDGPFRRQQMTGSVNVRTEGHPLFRERPQIRERHDLKAAGIGQHRAGPAHEGAQAAKRGHGLGAWPQHEVIGVSENDLRTGPFHRVNGHALHGPGRSHRHECRGVDDTVRRRQLSAPGASAGRQDLEPE